MADFGLRAPALFLVLGLAAPAFADSADAPAASAAPEKKICRSVEMTGSLMVHRTCHTKAEWAEIDTENRKGADHFRQASQNDAGGERPQ